MVLTRSQSIPRLNGHSEKSNGNDWISMDSDGNDKRKPKVNGKQATVQPAYDPAPRSTEFEFLGPPGALGITILTAAFTYFFAFACNEQGCPPAPVGPYFAQGLKQVQTRQFYADLWDTKATLAYLGWFLWCVVCWAVLPGRWIEGSKMRNGEKLWYKMNAFQTLVASMAGLVAVYYTYGLQPFLFAYDHWTGLITASLLTSVVLATYSYATSFIPGTMLAVGGNTGNVLYDWFIGRNLNPRISSFDIKSFCELRPGLILWLILNICMAVKQYTLLGRITDNMVLILLFQGNYVFDAVYNEPAVLTTMDITTDGFGYMLAVGDLLWVTFTYGLQARFLALHPKDLGVFWTAVIVAINLAGYYLFRTSNGEKNDFRNGKNPKNLTYMKTERGTNLLTSGWWGWSRHPNYLGDWIMAWAWCLPTGFSTPITYYYVIYFGILLLHRQNRDDEACKHKYGKDWDKYCKIVKWKIIPGVY